MFAARTAASTIVAALLALALAAATHPTAVSLAAGSCTLTRTSLALDSEEQSMLNLINNYRAGAGLGTLTLSPTLTAAAAWKSQDLGVNHYFAHDDTTRSWTQRLADCGYTASPYVAENLAAGNAEATLTFEQWRSSAAHNANLLNSSMQAIGLARAFVQGSPYGWYWTADFGGVVDGPSTPAPSVAGSPAAAPPTMSAPTATTTTGGTRAPAGAASPLSVNATAVVTGTGDCLRVHASPSLASNIVDCLSDGSAMVIADGPAVADGYTWWKLGGLGWAVDQYLTALP